MILRIAGYLVLHCVAFAATDSTTLLVPDKPKPKKILNCSDPQNIRDWKDIILAELDPAVKWADKQAQCVCGKAADKAGRNKPAPPRPNSVPAFPAFDMKDPDGGMKGTKDWYTRHLPVSEGQAERLAQCAYGEMYIKATAKLKTKKK